jgi:hypothetical protein
MWLVLLAMVGANFGIGLLGVLLFGEHVSPIAPKAVSPPVSIPPADTTTEANGIEIPQQSCPAPTGQSLSGEPERSATEPGTGQQLIAVKSTGLPAEQPPAPKPSDHAFIRLIGLLTNGIADDRIESATQVLVDDKLTADDKLTKIDGLIRFPATASAEQLGAMLGVTKQAVLKTDWWIRNRKGQKEAEIGRRRAQHQRRTHEYSEPTEEQFDPR